ncbi:MAG: hypothetical protein AB1374_05520 [Bacillota bacterium]
MPKALPLTLEKTISRVNIFLGGLGSGKTTIALNVALYAAAEVFAENPEMKAGCGRVALIDLDIVNPYFRSRTVQKEMAGYGVEVVCPPVSIAQGDIPALPAAIRGALDSSDCVVFDIGGDTVGATALGCYQPYILAKEHCLFFVVNVRRPFTGTAEKIRTAVGEIEEAARLKVNFLINNTNIGRETSLGIVSEGMEIVQQAAELLGIPVAFNTILEELAVSETGEVAAGFLPLKKMLRLPWE